MPITVKKSVRCSQFFGSGVLFNFDISFRILITVLFRATLNFFLLLHVPCLLVKIACISVPASVTVSVSHRAKVTTLPRESDVLCRSDAVRVKGGVSLQYGMHVARLAE